jgi:pectate lyase
MSKNLIIGLVIGAVVLSGVSFYAGSKYASSRGSNFARNFTGNNGGNLAMMRGGRVGGNMPVNGQIISADKQSVTVKLRTGGSKLVLLATSTQITKSTDGSLTDLTVGQEVSVIGSANTDGSVNGQNIQIRPAMQPAPTR